MNLREVREAADRVTRFKFNNVFTDARVMGQHIRTTIDPSPDAAITADWLSEAWGFEKAEWSKIAYENGHWSMVKVNDDCWHYEDDNFEWPHDLHTRQQFCDLARCLGIPRKQPKPEPEGCTCLSSPNMLYAPCSYCDKQRSDVVHRSKSLVEFANLRGRRKDGAK